jgi:hypothetical protein
MPARAASIKTRSTLKGTSDNFNEVRFDGKKGGEQFFMHHDRTVKVGNAAASKSVVDVKGSHDVTATEYIKLEVKGTFISIDEKSITLQVNGGGQIVIDTKVLAQAKEEGKLELTATAVMTAKEERASRSPIRCSPARRERAAAA